MLTDSWGGKPSLLACRGRKSYALSVRNRVTSSLNAKWTKPNCFVPTANKRGSITQTTSVLNLRRNLRTRKRTQTRKTRKMTEREGIRLGQQKAAKRMNLEILQKMMTKEIWGFSHVRRK